MTATVKFDLAQRRGWAQNVSWITNYSAGMQRAAVPTIEETLMLSFLRNLQRDRAWLARLPGLVLAFFVAELFYKFHSFALECLAFLATWLVIDLTIERLASRLARRDGASNV